MNQLTVISILIKRMQSSPKMMAAYIKEKNKYKRWLHKRNKNEK